MRTEMVSGCFQLMKPTTDVQLNDPPPPLKSDLQRDL